jgi:hypothetical protein
VNTYTRAAVVAAGAAALFALSPLSAVCGVVMALMAYRAVAGLEGAERRWIGGALVIGIGLRVLCVLGVFLLTGRQEQFNVLFGDGRFAVDRSIWILNNVSGVPISPFYWMRVSQNYGDVEYHYGLAAVQWLFGPSPYALSLINVACFEAFAIIFYRLTRAAFGATAAAATLTLLLFWPTILVWSFSMLKESLQFVLAIGAIACTVWCVRGERLIERLGYAIAALVALIVLTELRPGSSLMAAAAIAFGLIAYAATRRAWITIAFIVLASVAALAIATRPSVQARVLWETRLALIRHIGHVKSAGIAYRAADERFYRGERATPFSMNAIEGTRFLILSAGYFFAAPLPQHIASTTGRLFIPLQLAWYGLLILAVIGVPASFRRDALVTWLSIGYVLAGLATIAPNSGNIGTLIRHRDMIMPFIMCLSSVGLTTVLAAFSPLESDLSYASD